MLTYNTRLSFESQEDFQKILSFLEAQRNCVNEAYREVFKLPKLSIVDLHRNFYHPYVREHKVPSQMVIRSEKEALASYRSMKSNKHEKAIPVKTALSCRLDKRIYTLLGSSIKLTTLENRVKAKIEMYPKLTELWDKYEVCDPLLFVRDGQIWIALTFRTPAPSVIPKSVVGIDLGVCRLAATSEGNVFIDRKFNARTRKIRFKKKELQKKGTKSARKKSRKIGKKEVKMKNSMLHSLANEILKTSANVIVLEDLKGLTKGKKKKKQTKQTSFARLREILTYKAPLSGKKVETVEPHYTSQTNCLTGERDGERKGRRYYTKDCVLDADLNAAVNIAFKFAKLFKEQSSLNVPVSWRTPLDGQAVVNRPIVCQSRECLTSPGL